MVIYNKVFIVFEYIPNSFTYFNVMITLLCYLLTFFFFYNSIILLIIPIALNLIFTYIVISKEIKDNNMFAKWWIDNSKTALLFTLLAGADLESLNCVSSKCFNSMKLNAPLTEKTIHQI